MNLQRFYSLCVCVCSIVECSVVRCLTREKKFGRKLDKHTHTISKKSRITFPITFIQLLKEIRIFFQCPFILFNSIIIITDKIKNGHTTCLLFVCYSISTKYSLFQLKNFKKNGKKTRPSNLVSHSLWDPMLEKRITNKINKQNVVE